MLSCGSIAHLDCTKVMTFREIRKMLFSVDAPSLEPRSRSSSKRLLTDLLGSDPPQSLFASVKGTSRAPLFTSAKPPSPAGSRDVFSTSKLLDSLIGDFAEDGIFHAPIVTNKSNEIFDGDRSNSGRRSDRNNDNNSGSNSSDSGKPPSTPNDLLDSLLGDFSDEGVFKNPDKPLKPKSRKSSCETQNPYTVLAEQSTSASDSTSFPSDSLKPSDTSLASPEAVEIHSAQQIDTTYCEISSTNSQLITAAATGFNSVPLEDSLPTSEPRTTAGLAPLLRPSSPDSSCASDDVTAEPSSPQNTSSLYSSLPTFSPRDLPSSSSSFPSVSLPASSDPALPSIPAVLSPSNSLIPAALEEIQPLLSSSLSSYSISAVSPTSTLSDSSSEPLRSLSSEALDSQVITNTRTHDSNVFIHVASEPSTLLPSLSSSAINSSLLPVKSTEETSPLSEPSAIFRSYSTDLARQLTPPSTANLLNSLLGSPSEVNKGLHEDEEEMFSSRYGSNERAPAELSMSFVPQIVTDHHPSSPSFSSNNNHSTFSPLPSPSLSAPSVSVTSSALESLNGDTEWVRRTHALIAEDTKEESCFYLDPSLNTRLEGTPQLMLTRPVNFEDSHTLQDLVGVAERASLDTRCLCIGLGPWGLDHQSFQQVLSQNAPPAVPLNRTGPNSSRRSLHAEDPFGQGLMNAFQKGIDCFLRLENQHIKLQRKGGSGGDRNRDQRTEVPFIFDSLKYMLVSYCDDFFERVRARFSMTYVHFLTQLSTSNGFLCGGKSDGQSNAYIYTTNGNSFIVKSLRGDEPRKLRNLVTSAPYYSHLVHHPQTLLPRLFGLFQVIAPTFERWIMVANNVFDTSQCEIHRIYDLKGSTLFRRGTLRPQRTIFKDQDAIDMQWRMRIGPEAKIRLLQTLLQDVQFLESQNVMDYSLLVGVHDLQEDSSVRFYSPESGGPVVCSSETEIFFVGVIDILQDYNAFKMVESGIKALMYSKRDYSCVSPDLYAQRFINFISSIIL